MLQRIFIVFLMDRLYLGFWRADSILWQFCHPILNRRKSLEVFDRVVDLRHNVIIQILETLLCLIQSLTDLERIQRRNNHPRGGNTVLEHLKKSKHIGLVLAEELVRTVQIISFVSCKVDRMRHFAF